MVAEMLVMEEGIQKAGEENFACIAESSIFDKLDQKERCTFYQVGYFTVLECRRVEYN